MPKSARATQRPAGWTPDMWRAVRSPHRVHLLAALQALGEATAPELSEITGRTRQSIYPHLADLARVGIVSRSTRVHRGRGVVRFRYLPEVLAASVDERTGAGLRAAADVSARALHDAQIRCRRWGRVADGKPIDLSRNLEAVTSIRITWLDDRARARLNRLLRQVARVLHEGSLRRTGRRTCVLLFHFPDFTVGEARRELESKTAVRSRRKP